MELDLGEWTQLQLFKRNWLEPETLQLYGKLLKEGDIFIDVGAHVGFHSLVARQLIGGSGLVICVEPQPSNAQKVLSNWRANAFTNLKLFVAAAGAQPGTVELCDQIEGNRSMLTLLPDGVNNAAQQFIVPLIRLEPIIIELKLQCVTLLKIDVEGYEIEVLRGMGQQLRNTKNIVLEILPQTPEEHTKAVVELLQGFDFELLTIAGLPWVPGAALPESNLWARKKSRASSPN